MKSPDTARGRITRALYAAAAAGIGLATLGFTGTSTPAAAAARSLGSPAYTGGSSGYLATGQLFRFASITVTVPPVRAYQGNMLLDLGNIAHPTSRADILVRPGGGPGSAGWSTSDKITPFAMTPKVGDQLQVSIYCDQHGHTSFTATDLTQGVTRTVRAVTGNVAYDEVSLAANFASFGPWPPPSAGTLLWQAGNTQLTTVGGSRGTVTGPWQTRQLIQTSTGTRAGTVITAPSGLQNGGASFGIWLRRLPLAYTLEFAGYADSVGPFQYIATSMTVPGSWLPPGSGGTALVTLGHNGGATPRPYAAIQILATGGAGSVSYIVNTTQGTFPVSPKRGDHLSVSIYYDRHGHYTFTVTDATQAITRTVTVAAPYADSMPLNSAEVVAMFDGGNTILEPLDTVVWQFTGIHVTTYGGGHGSILGPWATSQWRVTVNGTSTGAVTAYPTVLYSGGKGFNVLVRHRQKLP